jgi:hypothetical protein
MTCSSTVTTCRRSTWSADGSALAGSHPDSDISVRRPRPGAGPPTPGCCPARRRALRLGPACGTRRVRGAGQRRVGRDSAPAPLLLWKGAATPSLPPFHAGRHSGRGVALASERCWFRLARAAKPWPARLALSVDAALPRRQPRGSPAGRQRSRTRRCCRAATRMRLELKGMRARTAEKFQAWVSRPLRPPSISQSREIREKRRQREHGRVWASPGPVNNHPTELIAVAPAWPVCSASAMNSGTNVRRYGLVPIQLPRPEQRSKPTRQGAPLLPAVMSRYVSVDE